MRASFNSAILKTNSIGGVRQNSGFQKRLEALTQFAKGDKVIYGGQIRGVFLSADLAIGNASIRVGAIEKTVNPLELKKA